APRGRPGAAPRPARYRPSGPRAGRRRDVERGVRPTPSARCSRRRRRARCSWPSRREPAGDLETAPWAAARLDRAARGGPDVLDDRETEPGPARRTGAVGAVEALEEARQVLPLDAAAVIRDDEHLRRPFLRDRDRARRSRAGI